MQPEPLIDQELLHGITHLSKSLLVIVQDHKVIRITDVGPAAKLLLDEMVEWIEERVCEDFRECDSVPEGR